MEPAWALEIKNGLRTKVIGHEVICYQRIDSTNDKAKELVEAGANEGVVIIAKEQIHGRGRFHGGQPRKWFSPPGGVYISIILKPPIAPHQAPKIALVSAIAMANFLQIKYQLDAGVKWPNDVLVNDKKICGVLTEGGTKGGRLEYLIVGLGINANVDLKASPKEVRATGTSIKEELKTEISLTAFIQNFLEEFERLYEEFQKNDLFPLLNTYNTLLVTPGRWIRITTTHDTFEGIAQGIDPDGGLILKLADNSVQRIISGEVIDSKRI
ncbi:MAG: biotin--[acetyl-CoA-carboxylase] ligase [Candidatus Heimdallarchaeota archaeon]